MEYNILLCSLVSTTLRDVTFCGAVHFPYYASVMLHACDVECEEFFCDTVYLMECNTLLCFLFCPTLRACAMLYECLMLCVKEKFL